MNFKIGENVRVRANSIDCIPMLRAGQVGKVINVNSAFHSEDRQYKVMFKGSTEVIFYYGSELETDKNGVELMVDIV